MSFSRINGILHAEQCSLQQLAQQFGTPLYVYSKTAFEKHYQDLDRAFDFIDHQICFAVKSNSNLAVLNVLAKLGSGFDIVTGGELARVLAAGGDPSKIVFSGLGKSEADIQKALEVGIACFNVESYAELDRIQKVAAGLNLRAPISLRVNPDVDAKTHPYISTGLKENKFGIPSDTVFETYQYAASLSHLDVVGIDCHIGSQLTETKPFVDALDRVIVMIEQLKTRELRSSTSISVVVWESVTKTRHRQLLQSTLLHSSLRYKNLGLKYIWNQVVALVPMRVCY